MGSIFEFLDKYMEVSAKGRQLIQNHVVEIHVPKGKIIIQQGKENSYLYIIKQGIVRGFTSDNEQEITVTLWQEMEPFGAIAKLPAERYYQALEDCTFFRLDTQVFRKLMETNLEIANLARLLFERYFILKEKRLYQNLHMSAVEKYNLFLTDHPGMIHRVKFIHVASFLGLTPETLSRIHNDQLKTKLLSIFS